MIGRVLIKVIHLKEICQKEGLLNEGDVFRMFLIIRRSDFYGGKTIKSFRTPEVIILMICENI